MATSTCLWLSRQWGCDACMERSPIMATTAPQQQYVTENSSDSTARPLLNFLRSLHQKAFTKFSRGVRRGPQPPLNNAGCTHCDVLLSSARVVSGQIEPTVNSRARSRSRSLLIIRHVNLRPASPPATLYGARLTHITACMRAAFSSTYDIARSRYTSPRDHACDTHCNTSDAVT